MTATIPLGTISRDIEFCVSNGAIAPAYPLTLPSPPWGRGQGEGDGGVMHQPHLLPRIREACSQALQGYLPPLKTSSDVEAYIVPPGLGDEAGVIGALHLAQEVWSLSATAGRNRG
jgi:hypothetical protein